MSLPVMTGYAAMILVEFEHDIRVATYDVEVMQGDALEILDEREDFLVTHDSGRSRIGRGGELVFLLDAPANNGIESRRQQHDERIASG